MFSAASKTASAVTAAGEVIFTNTAGASWVVPAGVTSISAVCIGGGGGGSQNSNGGSGGGGGDLRYYNNLSVTPGETLTITVGSGGTPGSTGVSGGFSRIARSSTTLLEAAGGGAGSISGSGAKNGTSSTIAGSIGGGNGGICADPPTTTQAGGGGGAGGYSGNGGDGAISEATGSAGAANSGAGGGGGSGGTGSMGGAGGGVNVFGIGSTGVGGGGGAGADADTATGGSYGNGGLNHNATSTDSYLMVDNFGGGGGGADNTAEGGNGGQGAVRIVWPGTSRSFPSTDVWMSSVLTTVIETQSSTSGSITIPSSAQSGDLAVLMNMHETIGSQTNPTGWTRIVNQEAASPVMTVWYRILQSGDANTAVTMTGGTTPSSEMIIFRKSSGSISSVNVTGGTIERSTGIPTTQTQNISTASKPFIAFGVLSSDVTTMGSSDIYFTGGIANSGNVEPSAVFTGGNGDTTRQGCILFRIYDAAPSTNLSVVCRRDISNQTMASFIIEVN